MGSLFLFMPAVASKIGDYLLLQKKLLFRWLGVGVSVSEFYSTIVPDKDAAHGTRVRISCVGENEYD